jgi:hypothetical protein
MPHRLEMRATVSNLFFQMFGSVAPDAEVPSRRSWNRACRAPKRMGPKRMGKAKPGFAFFAFWDWRKINGLTFDDLMMIYPS